MNHLIDTIEADRKLLSQVDRWAASAIDKELRGRLIRLQHVIEQTLAKLEEQFDQMVAG